MKPIGAWCEIEWFDDLSKGFRYVSFGTYDEESECDSFGVNDEAISFYCDDLDEFLVLCEKGFPEFDVLAYDLEYLDEVPGEALGQK